MTPKDFSAAIGLSLQHTWMLCREGFITGAIREGRSWWLPDDAAARYPATKKLRRAKFEIVRKLRHNMWGKPLREALLHGLPPAEQRKRRREQRRWRMRRRWQDPTERNYLRARQKASWTPERRAAAAQRMRDRWAVADQPLNAPKSPPEAAPVFDAAQVARESETAHRLQIETDREHKRQYLEQEQLKKRRADARKGQRLRDQDNRLVKKG